MANKCVLIPKVKNNKGELVESRLFKDLNEFTKDREDTYALYQVTRDPYFKENWNPKLQLDENSEPTINSLLSKTNIIDRIGDKKMLQTLNERIGGWSKLANRKKLYLYNQSNSTELFNRVQEFNNSVLNNKYIATVSKVQDNETGKIYLSPTVSLKTDELMQKSRQLIYNRTLNTKLRDILSKWGINVGALTELEERMGINGVMDLDNMNNIADGLSSIIRIAKGTKGEAALPEEFSHFIISALKNTPLVNRLFTQLSSNNLVHDVLGQDYDKYLLQYKGDNNLMIQEAAGKLLAQYMTREDIPASPYKSVLSRLIDFVKDFFGKFDGSLIDKARIEATQTVSELTKNIFSGSYDDKISIDSLTKDRTKLFSLSSTVDKATKLLESIKDRELKRYKIFENRNPGGKFNTTQAEKIRDMERSIENNAAIQGVYKFIGESLSTMSALNERLKNIQNSDVSLQKKASLLRDARNYIFSYTSSVNDIRQAIIEDEHNSDTPYSEELKQSLNNLSGMLDDALDRYRKAANPLFAQFLKPFMGEDIVIPFGKNQGKRLSVEQLIKEADSDINTMDRWLDSMANSSDYMLKLFDQAVKLSKEQKRLRVIDLSKQIIAAGQKLRDSGTTNFEWMFEKNKEGKLTGNYIDNINWGLLKERKAAFFEELKQKYGVNPAGEEGSKYRAELGAWYASNYEVIDGIRTPRASIYKNEEFNNLSAPQKEFYNKFMEIFSTLKEMLPDNTFSNKNQAIQIRKDLLERMISSQSITDALTQYKENLKDQLVDRTDDDEFGVKTDIEDFEGKKVRSVPIYYANKLEDTSALSTDVVSTLIAFSDMAINYDEMNKVVDSLEIGRDLMKDRLIQDTRGGKPLVQKIKTLGRETSLKINKGQSNFMARLNDFFDMQVYGIYMKDEGSTLGINHGKAVNFINKLTSLNQLAFNVLTNVATTAHDITQINAEALAGQFFNTRQLAKADKDYAKGLADSMNDIGAKAKTSKLNLFNEMFNVLQEYEEYARDAKFDKSKAARFFSSNTMYFGMHASDHWSQTRVALAMANNFKVKDATGKVSGLYDALEVTPVNKDNSSYGATIKLKDGYTKEDGSEFTKSDIISLSKKIMAVNERLYGIYNKADRAALQATAIGRLAFMYRKYLVPNMERRFGAVQYNMDLQDYTEGYYRTTGRFLIQLAKDIKSSKLIWATRFNELTDTEKANIIRAATETSQWLALSILVSLLTIGAKEKKQMWHLRALEYYAQRLKTDVGSLTPTPGMAGDLWKILKSPAAGMETLENLGNMVGIINPINWTSTVKAGRFKGYPVAMKDLLKSPFFPGSATAYKILHPEVAVQAYK